MTIETAVSRMAGNEHGDVIRESVRAVARRSCRPRCPSSSARLTVSEPRTARRIATGIGRGGKDTRAGEVELQIPKICQGSYFPSSCKPRKRSEQALVNAVQQAPRSGAARAGVGRSPASTS